MESIHPFFHFIPMKRVFLYLLPFALMACGDSQKSVEHVDDKSNAAIDPLPSWNDQETKEAIIEFVHLVSSEQSADFVPEEERIATFDNDGTLWAEKPLVQGMYAFYRVGQLAESHPEWKTEQPYKGILEKDTAILHHLGTHDLLKVILATHTGMTEKDFEKNVDGFFQSATYPGRDVPLKQITYQPQIELIQFLQENGFTVYICSGGTIEVIRSISKSFYNIEPQHVIGTRFKYVYSDADGNPVIDRMPEIATFNDKEEKPVNIQNNIGIKPILACGNVGGGGDIHMLRWSQTNSYKNLQLMVYHDDAEREYAYEEADSISLKWSEKYQWHVVSMKNDWKTIFTE